MPLRSRQGKVEQKVAAVMKEIDAEYHYWSQEFEKAREDLESGRRANDPNRAERARQRMARIEDRKRQINDIMAVLQELKDNIRFTTRTMEKYREIGSVIEGGDTGAEFREHLKRVTEHLHFQQESQAKLEGQMGIALAVSRAPLAASQPTQAMEPPRTAQEVEREAEELRQRLRKSRRLS
ncbi:MAG: hypothetical protein LC623_05010 [Halobacteriales archaeon]|nr:hypothetical protein [Halobacteriales archaeon]